jgi:DHA1 family multidrug resistance protein-like MFS transporter
MPLAITSYYWNNPLKNKNLLILFFTMIVVMLGFGMIIPVMPFYVKSFGASGSALGALMATYGFLQFLFAPFWGSLSDRYGRKPILMIGVLGNAIAQLLFGLSSALWMLFAARALAGILSSATLPTAMAYIGDSTSKEERGGGMGMIGAAMGIGMVLGPGLGGVLAVRSLSTPFFLASTLSMVALGLIFFFLPEPPREPNKVWQGKITGLQLGALWAALRGPLGVLFLMSFLLTFALTNFESVFGLYAADQYGYTTQQVGGVLTVVGMISAVMQGAATGPLTRRFGEVNVIRVSLLSSAFAFAFMTQAQTTAQILATVGFFIFSNSLINPSVSSLISKRTTGGQGAAMGANNSFQSLGRVVGPLWAGNMYDINYNLPYLSGAFLMLIGFGVSTLALKEDAPEVVVPSA